MIIRNKITLTLYWCVAFCSVVIAVKPPGYVEPPKVEDKNPPKYAYNYAITGEDKGVQGHHEVRNGINTTGNYFVKTGDAQSDVSYFSDDWGFHPVARYELKNENSHVSSHFALGKEAVDALNDNKDGRFPVPQEGDKSAPNHPSPSSPRPILPTKRPVFDSRPQQPQFVQFTSAPEPIQFVTPSKPQDSELNQPQQPGPHYQPQPTGPHFQPQPTGPHFQPQPTGPHYQPQQTGPHYQPPQNLAYEVVQQPQPHQQIHFVQVQQPNVIFHQQPNHLTHPQQPNEHEKPIPTNNHQQNPNLVFVKPDITYAPQNQPDITYAPQKQPQKAFVSVSIQHGPTKPHVTPFTKEKPQDQLLTFISTTPKYVTNEDVFNINAAVQPLPKRRPNPNEHEKSPNNPRPQEPRDKQLNSIAFQHPIVVGDFDIGTPEPIVSTTQANREYLPPLPEKQANLDLIKIDHNQGQFLKETTASLDVSHQSLEGDHDQHMIDSTSAPQKEAPSRYFLRQFKNRPAIVSTTTIKYPTSETLVITQRPISNKFLAPVQAGLKLANDDCNDEEEHKKHTVTKTIVEVQKSVNVIVDDLKKRPQFINRYTPRNPCSNGFGHDCNTKVIVQPHIIKEQVPVHIQTQKIIEKPVPYPVNHIIEKEVPIYKETVKEVKVPVYVPKPYPVKEIQQVQVPVEKTIIKEVPKIQQVIKEVAVDRPVYVDRHVIHEKFVDRPVEKIVDRPYPVEKIVHVDRPVIQEKIVNRPYPVEKIVHVDRPVIQQKTVVKEVHVDRPVEKIVHVDRPVPYEKIVHVPVEKIVEKNVEKIINRPYPVEKIVHVDRPVIQEKIINRPYPVEKIVHVDRPVIQEKTVVKEVPVVKEVQKIVHVDRPVIQEKIIDRPYPVEKIVHVDRPVIQEKIIDRPYPVEKIVHVDRPVIQEKIVDRPYPVEKIVNRPYPVEKVVHVDRPVEKIVHVDRPVPYQVEKIVEKEVPVEKIVYVDRIQEKIVEKEVPVEKIVHVDRPVDRPYPVEKIVHVDRPYPVEKVVEKIIDRPYPVEKVVEKIIDRPYPVEKIVHVDRPVDRPYPVEKIVHVDRPVQVPVYIPQPYPQPYPVHVEKKVPVHIPYEKKVVIPVYHEKPHLLKPIHKTNIKTNLFAQQHKIKHVYLDYPMPPPHSHYAYSGISHHQSAPIKIEKHISLEKPKFSGYHYEKPSIQLNVDHLLHDKPKAIYADKFSHPQPCIHSSHAIRDDYVGPTPFTSDYWATGTRDGITVKRHIENGRSLRIESGGFLPPIEPSTPIDANGVPLTSEDGSSK